MTRDSKSEVTIPPVMSVAIAGIAEVCETMFGISMDLAERPTLMNTDEMAYGLNLSLVRPQGSWELGFFGSDQSCKNLARALLGMGEDEEPALDETLDLLGEILNMVSGIVKGKTQGGAEVHLGVPLSLVGDDCKKYTPKVIPLFGQRLTSSDFEGEMFLVWSERERVGLAKEAAAILSEGQRATAQQLGSVISLMGEVDELLGADVSDDFKQYSSYTETVLMSLLNEELVDVDGALRWARGASGRMASVLADGKAHDFELEELPEFQLRQAESAPAEKVERDAEMLEMLADFLQESDEGLQLADQVLMEIEGGKSDTESINKLFRVFHSMKGLSSFLELSDITAIAHTTETLLAQVRDGKYDLAGSALDVVFESTEMMRSQLGSIQSAVEAQVEYPPCPGRQELIDRLEAVMRGEAISAPRAVGSISPAAKVAEAPKLKETVKIATELVAKLADTSSRLTAFEQRFREQTIDGLPSVQEELARLSNELREVSALMQMISIGTLFSKMTRMVRDLSKKTGKLARVVLAGEDTMVPRAINEKLGDPLVHMIRNAVDHGIEGTDDRKAAGKPPMGSIGLSAEHEELDGKRWVVLRLQDDGKGLKRDVILSKAVSKGLMAEGAQPSDDEVFDLIFAPGFSTAAAVTAISGRGVGMDVVRKNIQGLGGSVQITSQEGQGSTFTIRLPLVV